jgi:hypothetical protein
MPTVSVSAKSSTGQALNDVLSKTEAAFVTGSFADKAAAQASAAAASAANPPFVLPGVTIQIFPIGMILTGIWSVLFLTFVGLGTYGRLQFRQAYRRRSPVNTNWIPSGNKGGPAAYDRR